MGQQSPTSYIRLPRNPTGAMAQLNPQQQKFVIALIETGGNKVRAALAAGYGASKEDREIQTYQSAATAGTRLSHDPRIIAAVKEQAEMVVQTSAVKAAAVLVELMDASDPKVRLKAAQDTLDRSGLSVARKQDITVHHDEVESKSVKELIKFIREQAASAGVDPRRLLENQGVSPEVLDAEFEEVEPGSTEGLEDLLG